MVTHASRNIGLRRRGSGNRSLGQNVDPARAQPVSPVWPDMTQQPDAAALGNAPGPGARVAGDVVLGANRDPARAMPAPFPPTEVGVSAGQRTGPEILAPLAPWDTHAPSNTFGPADGGAGGIGGDWRFPTQQVDERLLPVQHPVVTADAGQGAGGLGKVLAGAVVPTPPPRPRVAVAAAPQARSPWVTQAAQNNDPNARFQQQMGMLDLSRLFGGG